MSSCSALVLSRWRHVVQYKNDQFLKFAQKIFIFSQNLEKFAQKQNVLKFWKNLPNFQKSPNTCSPANVSNDDDWLLRKIAVIHIVFKALLHQVKEEVKVFFDVFFNLCRYRSYFRFLWIRP